MMPAGAAPALLQLLGPNPQPGLLSLAQWDTVVRQGRSAGVLGRLAAQVEAQDAWQAVPAAPRAHLQSAWLLVQRQQRELRFEVQHIARALAPTGVALVLLKGSAYALGGLQAGRGRLVSDVDILVPRARLAAVESALLLAGWGHTKHDAYDQQYYRRWMHELPPLRHIHRGTVLDVHHALLPGQAPAQVAGLLQAVQTLAPGLQALASADQLLHSAVHLFHESEFGQGFRGLVDIDALLREAALQPDFWPQLLARAQALGWGWPLHHGLRYAQALLASPVPAEVLAALAPSVGQAAWQRRLRDGLYLRVLQPPHPSSADRWTPLARGLLYLQGQRLRQPLHRLLPHLARKSLRALWSER
jgi:hypothetical protein